jgi:hypothetical protein
MSDKLNIYLLKPRKNDSGGYPSHFCPWYDKAFGFVVCSYEERDARELAAANAGDEAGFDRDDDLNNPWLDERYTDCFLLGEANGGFERVVLMSRGATTSTLSRARTLVLSAPTAAKRLRSTTPTKSMTQ